MFEFLPIELEKLIYKIYFEKYVLSIIKTNKPVYLTMSQKLIKLVNKDKFAADPIYFCNQKDLALQEISPKVPYLCMNCYCYGFRCINCFREYKNLDFIDINLHSELQSKECLEISNSLVMYCYNRLHYINHNNYNSKASKKHIIKMYFYVNNLQPEFE